MIRSGDCAQPIAVPSSLTRRNTTNSEEMWGTIARPHLLAAPQDPKIRPHEVTMPYDAGTTFTVITDSKRNPRCHFRENRKTSSLAQRAARPNIPANKDFFMMKILNKTGPDNNPHTKLRKIRHPNKISFVSSSNSSITAKTHRQNPAKVFCVITAKNAPTKPQPKVFCVKLSDRTKGSISRHPSKIP